MKTTEIQVNAAKNSGVPGSESQATVASDAEPIRSINVYGRRWFQRGAGNTYHAADIVVNGRTVHKIDFAYGYGDQYLWNATAWLAKNGYLPDLERYSNGAGESLWRYAERKGFTCEYFATDVSRKKDL